jgi:hypothetical protein
MRSLVVLVLAAACGHKAAPTSDWCFKYINDVRVRGDAAVRAMTSNEADRRGAANFLLALVGPGPALEVAFDACSDADGDLAEVVDTRKSRVAAQQSLIATYVSQHTSASRRCAGEGARPPHRAARDRLYGSGAGHPEVASLRFRVRPRTEDRGPKTRAALLSSCRVLPR